MPSSQDFEDLYGVTEERAFNFWVSELRDVMDKAVAYAIQAPYPDPKEVSEDIYA